METGLKSNVATNFVGCLFKVFGPFPYFLLLFVYTSWGQIGKLLKPNGRKILQKYLLDFNHYSNS